MANLRSWWKKVTDRLLGQKTTRVSTQAGNDQYVPKPDDYPVFPPLAPRDILQDPGGYWAKVSARRYGAPQGVYEDSPLFALYRFYEVIVLDKVISYRNALEAFWRQSSWAVQDIPDPEDSDVERYAFLAGCTYLLARSFNQRVNIGLSRNRPSLLTPEEAEEARNVPDNLRQYEKVPGWAQQAPALTAILVIPTDKGELLEGKDDSRADPDFLAKNILLWTPHIQFT